MHGPEFFEEQRKRSASSSERIEVCNAAHAMAAGMVMSLPVAIERDDVAQLVEELLGLTPRQVFWRCHGRNLAPENLAKRRLISE